MKLTQKQLQSLSGYEQHFDTAVNGNWSRYPGRVALEEIHRILEDVTGTKIPLNTNCQSCVLKLLQDCGRLYFREKEALIQAKNDAKAVNLTKEMAASVKKVSVKTRTKKTK